MKLLQLTRYLLANRLKTVAIVFIISCAPLLNLIGLPIGSMLGALGVLIAAVLSMTGLLIATFITLMKGWKEGLWCFLAATLPYVAGLYPFINHHANVPFSLWAGIAIAIISNALTYLFAVMVNNRISWVKIFQLAALLGVLVVSVVHLIYPDIANWWGQQLQASYEQASHISSNLSALPVTKTTPVSLEQLQWIQTNKQYATGVMTAAVIFSALFQLLIARWWQANLFAKGSLQRELHQIRLNRLASLLFIVSIILNYFGNRVILDIMPILCLLFVVAGLSLVHYLFGLMSNKTSAWVWLTVVYIIFTFSLPISIILLCFFAILDSGIDLRKFLHRT